MDGNFYQLELLGEIEQAGELTVRGRVPFRMLPGRPLSDLEKAVEMRRRWNSDRLKADFVKIFMDGVIEFTTAHMVEEYCGMPGESAIRFSIRMSSTPSVSKQTGMGCRSLCMQSAMQRSTARSTDTKRPAGPTVRATAAIASSTSKCFCHPTCRALLSWA